MQSGQKQWVPARGGGKKNDFHQSIKKWKYSRGNWSIINDWTRWHVRYMPSNSYRSIIRKIKKDIHWNQELSRAALSKWDRKGGFWENIHTERNSPQVNVSKFFPQTLYLKKKKWYLHVSSHRLPRASDNFRLLVTSWKGIEAESHMAKSRSCWSYPHFIVSIAW